MKKLTINNYSLSIGGRNLLSNTKLDFEYGKINHIMGRNGVGKSQFAIDIVLNRSKKMPRFWMDNSMLISSVSNIPLDITLNDLISTTGDSLSERIFDMLNMDNINPNLRIRKMSDGQKQKIKLWVYFSANKDIMVLDEITNAIDKKTTNEIYEFLNGYIAENDDKIVLNISHNINDIKKLPGNYYIIDDLIINKVDDADSAISWYING